MSGHPLLVFEGHDNAVTCFLQVSDGSIVSGSMDTTLRHWDVQSGECLRVMLGHVKSVTALLELRDGRIASSSLDHTIRLWDLQHGEGQVLRVMEGHGHYGVTCLCQLADGRLLSGGEDTRVMVWELDKVEDSTYTPAILGFNDSVKEMHDGHRHSVCCITQLAGFPEPCPPDTQHLSASLFRWARRDWWRRRLGEYLECQCYELESTRGHRSP